MRISRKKVYSLSEPHQQCKYGDDNYFYCKNGETTLCSFRCDGDNDCGDNSDEEPYVCPFNKKIKLNPKSDRVRVQRLVYILSLYSLCKGNMIYS